MCQFFSLRLTGTSRRGLCTKFKAGYLLASEIWTNVSVYIYITEGSLEVKLLTIWTDETAEVGRVREEKGRRKKIREE